MERNNSVHHRVDLEPADSCGVGMIASIRNEPTRKVLDLGLAALANVAHRGAVNADGLTGDGSGVSTSLPRKLIERWLAKLGITEVPALVGVGSVFLPSGMVLRKQATDLIETTISFHIICHLVRINRNSSIKISK